jgi:hypothetical protein
VKKYNQVYSGGATAIGLAVGPLANNKGVHCEVESEGAPLNRTLVSQNSRWQVCQKLKKDYKYLERLCIDGNEYRF